jgi:DNA mismatch repair protein MutS
MAQYQAIKSQYPDAILFFHIGDFYETFGSDAETVSRELDIVLTSRSRDSSGQRVPLAGVPCHAAEGYIARLIARGFRVAVCDQVEDPKAARGIVKREVVRVITPGMVMDEALLSSGGACYLMGLAPGKKGKDAGLAFLDVSTGEFIAAACRLDDGGPGLLTEVARYRPAECLLPDDISPEIPELLGRQGLVITRRPAILFDEEEGRSALCAHFRVAGLEGFGIVEHPAAIRAAAAALRYARDLQKSELPQVTRLRFSHPGELCVLDAISLRNLEVLEGIRGGSEKGTLLSILDRTATPMGGRLLKQWLSAPLRTVEAINSRLDAVEYLVSHAAVRMEAVQALRRVSDIGRIAGRIAYGSAGPRDLASLRRSLEAVPAIRALFSAGGQHDPPAAVREACAQLADLSWAADLIARALVDEPPALPRNGGMIRDGYDAELDAIREVTTGGKDWILALQQQERERTGIKSLKVGYNSVFGYYIEVTKANLALAPPEYQRKQTTSTAERFTIPPLKEKEALIAKAEERLLTLEQEIYRGILERLGEAVPLLQATAEGIATLDVFSSLAQAAEANRYSRPVVDDSCTLLIREGRHPVVEQAVPGKFVPNDASVSCSGDQVLIITGANMAGKSTYMRAVALSVIMAQAGSFVPADYARIGVADRIFTRVGAFDDLASGQSTFLVEMLELANILNHVTERSLVVLDEIGRGTSTLDGFCIARAVLEYLHGKGPRGPRTLFATHFHELVEAEADLPRVRNFHFAVRDTGDQVVFLRKIIPGATDRSYGIHVAALAGIPRRVTDRARALLEEVSRHEGGNGVKVKRFTQMLLVDAPPPPRDPVSEELAQMDLDEMTPLSALTRLYELQRKAREQRD